MYIKDGIVTAESTTGIGFDSCEIIKNELQGFFEDNKTLILDGELFSECLTFEELVGLVKRKSTDAECKFKYHVYDIYDTSNENSTFNDRFVNSETVQALRCYEYVEIVETSKCDSATSVNSLYDEHKLKYEGSIVRNNTPYAQKRSCNLLKLKGQEEDEYLIVGYRDGIGREKGQVIWECKTKSGTVFQCRPKGNKESRSNLLRIADTYVGSYCTVMYQELTSKGVPRFPIGKCVRNYE